MSESVNDIVEVIVANVYQDGVFVLRNGQHHHITPQQVRDRWVALIDNQVALGNFIDTRDHGQRLFAYVQDHQVAFVWMDLDAPLENHQGDWRAMRDIETWRSRQAARRVP